LAFQWTLLSETGYKPTLTSSAPGDVFEFAPASGGVLQPGEVTDGPRWKVRRTTLECLVTMGVWPEHSTPSVTVDRANRLLAAYTCHILGTEPATMRAVFSNTSS